MRRVGRAVGEPHQCQSVGWWGSPTARPTLHARGENPHWLTRSHRDLGNELSRSGSRPERLTGSPSSWPGLFLVCAFLVAGRSGSIFPPLGIQLLQDGPQSRPGRDGGRVGRADGDRLLDEGRILHREQLAPLVELPAVVAGIPAPAPVARRSSRARVPLLAPELGGRTSGRRTSRPRGAWPRRGRRRSGAGRRSRSGRRGPGRAPWSPFQLAIRGTRDPPSSSSPLASVEESAGQLAGDLGGIVRGGVSHRGRAVVGREEDHRLLGQGRVARSRPRPGRRSCRGGTMLSSYSSCGGRAGFGARGLDDRPVDQVLRQIKTERLVAMTLHEVEREVGRQVGVVDLLAVRDLSRPFLV